MQIHLVFAWNQRQSRLQILTQVIRCTGVTRVTAGYRNASAQFLVFKKKPFDVIALPAVQGNFDLCELRKHFIHIDSMRCI
ncbi:hypothetical protein D3C75_1022790 [compost metagenome]